jgi:hypothetical protein
MGSGNSHGRAGILAGIFATTTVVLAVALGWTWAYFYKEVTSAPEPELPKLMLASPGPVSPLLINYQLDLPGRGEVFPALAGSERDLPLAVLTVVNTSDRPLVQNVSAEVPGWTEYSQKVLVLGARETRTVHLSPELLPRAFQNNEIRRATLKVTVNSPDSGTSFAQSRPVYLHGAYDLYWGKKFSNAQFVARWVTPHDPEVLRLVSQARKYAPRGRMPGYDRTQRTPQGQAREVRVQARAVFEAMRDLGLSYVSSVYTFGSFADAQRIRAPRETLTLSSANCIDVSVAFASAMENLGLDPMVLIVPGHAFVGVRTGPGSAQVLYLDLTVLPKGGFDAAVARAHSWLKKTPPDQVLTVDVAAARALGIYPIPDQPAPVATARGG